jgi:branched-chain amino acid transport system substrate-binding protein
MAEIPTAVASLAIALLQIPSAAPTAAELTVGVTRTERGSGVPSRDTLALLPARIGDLHVRYVVLDDAGDPGRAARNARRFAHDERVDVIVCSNSTAASLAVLDVAAETGTPMITLATGKGVVAGVDEKRRWAFKTPPDDDLMAAAVADHMRALGVRTVAFIGSSDAFGEAWWAAFSSLAAQRGLEIVVRERFRPWSASVDSQVATILAAGPDAVLVGAAGAPAALPAKALARGGYRGRVYHTQGAVTDEFLRAGGEAVEGAFVPVGPAMVAAQLPDGHPSKRPALEFLARWEEANGHRPADAAAAHAWDAGLLLRAAVPVAALRARPGTPGFREALRAALENVHGLAATHGVFEVSPTNHQGFDRRARVMARIEHGTWKVAR